MALLVERVREAVRMMPARPTEAEGTKAVAAATKARKRATMNFIAKVDLCLLYVCNNWLVLSAAAEVHTRG